MEFKFYVLNYNFNENKVEMFNIFRNWKLSEYTEKAIKEYLKSPKDYKYVKEYGDYVTGKKEEVIYGFEGLCKTIESLIMWQEWGRCEYEIGVTSIHYKKGDKIEKWDCYEQAKANIEAITRECIYQYEHRNDK